MFTLLYTASTMSGKMKRVKVVDANIGGYGVSP